MGVSFASHVAQGATQITYMRRTLGNVRRTIPLYVGQGRTTCVVPYKGATQIAEPSASFPYTTQIISESFASRALASHHSPTQIGASHPTQIAFFVLVKFKKEDTITN